MKTKFGIALLAMIALAFVVAAPAAASLNTIATEDTVFVGEEGLNFTDLAAGTLVVWYESDTTGAYQASYTITEGATNYIDPAKFASKTGAWYNFTSGDIAFNVDVPNLDVKVYTTGGNDRTDGTVVKGDDVTFRIYSNLYQLFDRGDFDNTTDKGIDIVVKDDQGTKYIALDNGTDDVSIVDIYTESNPYYMNNDVSIPVWDTGAYSTGVFTFYATCDVNDMDDNYAATGGTISKVYTLTVAGDTVSIEANKDTVVRNSDFAVTVTGKPNTFYVLWIEGTAGVSQPPVIKANQDGVTVGSADAGTYEFSDGKLVEDDTAFDVNYAYIKTASSGTRTIGFSTNQTTTDQTYTIRVQQDELYTTAKNDKVKVKVEKGDITVTASGDSSYFLGEEIILSGTNTESEDVFLFITGPNLFLNGQTLDDGTKVVSDDENTFTQVNVETDDTWEKKWDTAGSGLDAGTYTIYAVTSPKDKSELRDATYATVAISLKKPFVTATTSAAVVAKGNDLYISGTAEGDPSNVYIWILGKNKADIATETVEDDGTFEYKFVTDSSLASGQYFVVVQHPMYNGLQDVYEEDGDVINRINMEVIFELDELQSSDAAEALVQALNSPNVDDTYYKLTFMVEEPWIIIDAVGDRYVGETFTITGTTNLAVGDSLIIEVVSSSFQPTEKTAASAFYGATGTILVTEGEDANAWEFAVDASNFKPDQYIVKIESVEADATATQTFNVLKAVPTVEPTEQPTVTPTEEPTEVPTTEATPEEAAPGFGALVALIGLGAVAALVLRKD